MSICIEFYKLNKKAFNLIQENGYNFWLLLDDQEAYEDYTGEPAPGIDLTTAEMSRLNVGDWNLNTPEFISNQFGENSELVLNALNTLAHTAGQFKVEKIDFGYAPADIYTSIEIEELVLSIESVFNKRDESSAGDTTKWLAELIAALKSVLASNSYILKTIC
jgi:hypothetical protein